MPRWRETWKPAFSSARTSSRPVIRGSLATRLYFELSTQDLACCCARPDLFKMQLGGFAQVFEALLLRVPLGVDVEFGAVDRETALFFGDEISGDAQAGHANLREFVGGRTND